MVKSLSATLLAFFCFAAVGVAAEYKFAVLDVQRAIGDSEEAKSLATQVEQDLKGDQDALQKLAEDIQAVQERLQNDAEILGDAEKRGMQKDIQDKQIDYEFGVNKFRKELQDRQQEIFRQMGPKLDAVLTDLIEIEGYDVVLPRAGLLYVNTKHDITRKVTEKLNEKQ